MSTILNELWYLKGIKGELKNVNVYNLRGFVNRYFKLNENKTVGSFTEYRPCLDDWLDSLNIPYVNESGTLQYTGYNLCDFLHKIFSEQLLFCDAKPYKMYLNEHCKDGHFKLNHPNAIAPAKSRFSDTGFDLHIISLKKKIGLTNVYNTHVSVKPPSGYYFDVVPRSSITKMGYFQTNSVGIIDCGYTGDILIGLTKMNKDIDDLELPCKIAQLIPRKLELITMRETLDIKETSRGSDGGIAR